MGRTVFFSYIHGNELSLVPFCSNKFSIKILMTHIFVWSGALGNVAGTEIYVEWQPMCYAVKF